MYCGPAIPSVLAGANGSHRPKNLEGTMLGKVTTGQVVSFLLSFLRLFLEHAMEAAPSPFLFCASFHW